MLENPYDTLFPFLRRHLQHHGIHLAIAIKLQGCSYGSLKVLQSPVPFWAHSTDSFLSHLISGQGQCYQVFLCCRQNPNGPTKWSNFLKIIGVSRYHDVFLLLAEMFWYASIY